MKPSDLNETIAALEKAAAELGRLAEGNTLPMLRLHRRGLSLLADALDLQAKLEKKSRS